MELLMYGYEKNFTGGDILSGMVTGYNREGNFVP